MDHLKNEITISAKKSETAKVVDSISDLLFNNGVDFSTCSKIGIALEEVLVNVASYAYEDEQGSIVIEYELVTSPSKEISLTIIDSGKEFDPLAKEDPNIVTLYEEKKIGGLGIYLTKQIMDEVSYERKDGKNILFLKKRI